MVDYNSSLSSSTRNNKLAAETSKRRLLNDHDRDALLRNDGYGSAEFPALDSGRSLYEDIWRKIGPTSVQDIPMDSRYDMLASISCEPLIGDKS